MDACIGFEIYSVSLVHGFLNATYHVIENDTLETLFQYNVKGETEIHSLDISGLITAKATPNSTTSKKSVTCSH